MKHKVTCALCGKKQIVQIDERTGKIKSEWAYFGKFNENEINASKYLYELKDCEKPTKFTHAPAPNHVGFGTMRDFAPRRNPESKDATAVRPWSFTRILNPNYNPKIKPKYVEYWECPECYRGER